METMTCPKCQGEMAAHRRGGVDVAQCESCSGIFLDRVDRSTLIDNENDWHVSRGPQTQPLPRITESMPAPPPAPARPQFSSFVDGLFG
ncbi:MAG TPA: zf-TFIIB domain-containing protein [Nocardioidaceae bacterium]|nr:zf-TFIIB domain-containing protein [Nocardioidaceae bacterium]